MLLLSTDSLKGYGLNRIFSFAKQAGFDGVELALDAKEFDTQNADYLNEISKNSGVKIIVVRTFSNSNTKKTEIALEIAKKVNAQTVVLEPPKLFDFKYKKWMRTKVPKLRNEYKMEIALKNGPSETLFGFLPGRSMNSIPDLQKFKQVCIDTSYLYSKKLELLKAYKMIKKYMVHIHLSNVRKGKEHCYPTEGTLPLESFLTRLKKDKYKGTVSLLLQPKELRAGKDDETLKLLKKAKKFYNQYMG